MTMCNSSCAENSTLNQTLFDLNDAHFAGYEIIRILQAIIGVTGNIMTLIIIKNLKSRANGHILITYLAVSDILVCCVAPMPVMVYRVKSLTHWKTLCIIKEYFYISTMAFST